MKVYVIAHISIIVENLDDNLDVTWNLFQKADIESITPRRIKYEIFFGTLDYKKINRDIKISLIENSSNIVMSEDHLMVVNQDYSAGYSQNANKKIYNTFLNLLFYSQAIRKNMIQLHCAVIENKGEAVIFLGPSGIGKTTQAECWEEYRHSQIINGDIGLVQKKEGKFVVWGTPWHGSSPYCINTNVPLKAMVVLKQSPNNSIRKLEGFEKLAEVSANVFYPTWLEDGISLCTEILGKLLDSIPVYRLDNRADEESVKLLEDELKTI